MHSFLSKLLITSEICITKTHWSTIDLNLINKPFFLYRSYNLFHENFFLKDQKNVDFELKRDDPN